MPGQVMEADLFGFDVIPELPTVETTVGQRFEVQNLDHVEWWVGKARSIEHEIDDVKGSLRAMTESYRADISDLQSRRDGLDSYLPQVQAVVESELACVTRASAVSQSLKH